MVTKAGEQQRAYIQGSGCRRADGVASLQMLQQLLKNSKGASVILNAPLETVQICKPRQRQALGFELSPVIIGNGSLLHTILLKALPDS